MTVQDNTIGAYLAARRALVTPEQAGIPAGSGRRVPGLRREEVAMLAGISVDYYVRLERGRDRHPSPQVLESLARVLHLDDVETDYLLGLAVPAPRPRRRRPREHPLPARAHDLLAALTVPAFVENRVFDVLASNTAAQALNPRLTPGRNRLRDLLLDPAERDMHEDWEHSVHEFVAAFRHTIAARPDDPAATALVGELSIASARFRALWARQDVRTLDGGTVILRHPQVGALRLHRDKLPLGDHILVLYYPQQDSENSDKLNLLLTLGTRGTA